MGDERVGGVEDRDQIRFLGMNLKKEENGIFLHQQDYVEELLTRHKDEVKKAKAPMSKEMADEAEETIGDHTMTDLARAQKVTGEILWLMTRTRPDLRCRRTRSGSSELRATSWATWTRRRTRGCGRQENLDGIGVAMEQQDFRHARMPPSPHLGKEVKDVESREASVSGLIHGGM